RTYAEQRPGADAELPRPPGASRLLGRRRDPPGGPRWWRYGGQHAPGRSRSAGPPPERSLLPRAPRRPAATPLVRETGGSLAAEGPPGSLLERQPAALPAGDGTLRPVPAHEAAAGAAGGRRPQVSGELQPNRPQ